MREIKFRAWDTKEKRMFVPFELKQKLNQRLGEFSEDIILLQYTGLKDKNGVEIYEGDILQSTSTFVSWGTGLPTGQGDCVETFEVFYIEYEARFTLKAINAQRHRGYVSSFSISQSQITKYYTVIGNIYENPELLKQGE